MKIIYTSFVHKNVTRHIVQQKTPAGSNTPIKLGPTLLYHKYQKSKHTSAYTHPLSSKKENTHHSQTPISKKTPFHHRQIYGRFPIVEKSGVFRIKVAAEHVGLQYLSRIGGDPARGREEADGSQSAGIPFTPRGEGKVSRDFFFPRRKMKSGKER